MDADALGRGEPGGQEQGRPVHAVEAQDVLADDVVGLGPPVGEALGVAAVADGGGVVDEGVVPDVEDVLGVPRDLDAPVDRRAADGDVPQALADEAEGLVALALGLHEVGVGLVPVEQGLLEGRQGEEPVLLAEVLDRAVVDRAVAVDQVVLGVVRLAGHAVQALVGVLVDVAVVLGRGQQLLHGGVVAGLGGADEVVVADVQQLPGLAVAGAGDVGLLLGAEAVLLGGPGHLQAVLVGPGQEEDVLAEQPVPPGQAVGDDRGVGVADVGRVVDVVDRRRDVEAAHTARLPTPRNPPPGGYRPLSPPGGPPGGSGRATGVSTDRQVPVDQAAAGCGPRRSRPASSRRPGGGGR